MDQKYDEVCLKSLNNPSAYEAYGPQLSYYISQFNSNVLQHKKKTEIGFHEISTYIFLFL